MSNINCDERTHSLVERQKGRKSSIKLNWKYDKCATKDFHPLSQRISLAMLLWKVIFLTLYSQSTSVPLLETCNSLHPLTLLWLYSGISRLWTFISPVSRIRTASLIREAPPWSSISHFIIVLEKVIQTGKRILANKKCCSIKCHHSKQHRNKIVEQDNCKCWYYIAIGSHHWRYKWFVEMILELYSNCTDSVRFRVHLRSQGMSSLSSKIVLNRTFWKTNE